MLRASALGKPVAEYARLLRATVEVGPSTHALIKLLLKNRRYGLRDAASRRGVGGDSRGPVDIEELRAGTRRQRTNRSRAADLRQHRRRPRIEWRGQIRGPGWRRRCYKQLMLDEPNPARRVDYLQRALEAYGGVYHANPARYWHGINATALLHYAVGNPLRCPASRMPAGYPRDRGRSAADGEWATRRRAPTRGPTLRPARHTRPRGGPSRTGVGREARQDRGDRCLRRRITAETARVGVGDRSRLGLGHTLLPVLRSAQVHFAGGSVMVGSRDVSADRLQRLEQLHRTDEGLILEKVFGADRFRTLNWWRKGLTRCRAVVRIDDSNGAPIGTGFLVRGPVLHPGLPDVVVVTNCHVIPDRVHQSDAVVSFLGLGDDEPGRKKFEVKRLWWHSSASPPGVDTAILELDGLPANVEPVPLASALPLTAGTLRAYVIGHPRGYDQPQFSIQDNKLVDHDDNRLHYRSPTEGGSSGSPVFEEQWKLIGLHHAGSATLSCLSASGTHEANEALRISAIRRALEADPPRATDASE